MVENYWNLALFVLNFNLRAMGPQGAGEKLSVGKINIVLVRWRLNIYQQARLGKIEKKPLHCCCYIATQMPVLGELAGGKRLKWHSGAPFTDMDGLYTSMDK